MGLRISSPLLPQNELDVLVKATKLSADQIIILYKRFKRLDKDASGTLSYQEMLNIPEFAMNPLAPRIFSILAHYQTSRSSPVGKSSVEIDFLTFAKIIALFSDHAAAQDHLELALKIIDYDGDGQISLKDINQILGLMVGDQIQQTELEPIAGSLYNEMLVQARGSAADCRPLSKDEFFTILKKRPFLGFLNISL